MALRTASAIRIWSAGLGAAVEDLVFPPSCVVCGESCRGPEFCEECRGHVVGGRSCPRCASAVGPWADLEGGCSECRGHPLGFDAAIALGFYSGSLRELCLRMKAARHGWLARPLVDLLVENRREALEAAAATLIVPVPLHWWSRWRRGYNQAQALAARLGHHLGIDTTGALRRVSATRTLARLGKAERARVMRGVFRVARPAAVAGRTILLVDDILTTGATCGAAARALKAAGAKRVVAVVLARAEKQSG